MSQPADLLTVEKVGALVTRPSPFPGARGSFTQKVSQAEVRRLLHRTSKSAMASSGVAP
jgi:hypothetical protein